MDLVKKAKPYLFDEFFDYGLEESVSPFLKKESRKWGRHLSLKSSLFSLFLLIVSFSLSFHALSLSYLFLSFVYFLMGVPSLIGAIEDLKKLEINIDLLMTFSAFIALWIGTPFEGALLLVLFATAGAIEEAVSFKTRATLHSLRQCVPSSCYLLQEDGSLTEKSIQEIKVGMKLFVKSGENIPVDGKVLEGFSSVSMAHLTGEALPIEVTVGSELSGGALNLSGSLAIVATKEGNESTIQQIIQLVASAQEKKPKIERFFYRFGKAYSLFVILATLLFAAFLPFFFSFPYFGREGSIYRALTFMIAASPCALILAIPSAYLSALSAAAKKGLLLKGGSLFDALNSCQTIAFDKTGTLTQGALRFVSLTSLDTTTLSSDIVLQIGASLEKASTHPIAIAICKSALEKKLSFLPVKDFVSIPGNGVQGKISLHNKIYEVRLGKPSFIESFLSKEQKTKLQRALIDSSKKGQLSTLLFIDSTLFLFHLQDSLRKQTKKLIEELKAQKMRSLILTGDSEENAKAIGEAIGIQEIYAHLLPEDKLAKVSALSKKGLIMVGDGVNDAPSLARATVGISMGQIGSGMAIHAADVILLNDEIRLISWLLEKAKITKKIVRENLTLALAVICTASLPALFGLIPLWIAVILHEGGTLLVGLNSLRLLRK
jgi:Zn2+/Cd2+-exporting ATPase